jgi:predicted RNase H-like HicB family nuclease
MVSQVYALIHDEAGVFGISFPDFPGCVSGGESAEEALARGREALAFHIAGMAEDGDAIPPIRSFTELRKDKAFNKVAKGAILALVPADLPGRAARINISIEEGLLDRIDQAAKARGESRSRFLATAAKERLRQS